MRTMAWVVLALLAAHDLTHAVDGGLDTGLGELAIVSIPQWLLLAAVMWILLRGDPARSRTAALVLGAAVAAGFVVVHLLPFSPAAYWDLDPSTASWALVWLPIAAGLGLAGLAVSRSG